MFPGLDAALKSRRKYVDDSSEVSMGAGTGGSERSRLNEAIQSGASRFLMLQGGLTKSPSGFTGLVNQGATCYLNSLIQTLYMLPDFRLALYGWKYDPRSHGEESRCLSRQLQRLFSQLQLSARPAVTTGNLTKSFGWTNSEAFVQQDVHECMSVIFDILQEQSLCDHICASHRGKLPFSQMYSFYSLRNWCKTILGQLFDYLLCSKCGGQRGRQDQFRDIHLEVRGMKSISQMLDAFVAGENLDGVECEVCNGRYTHKKALAIGKIPRILTLQLKRFDLDYNTWQRVKLNDQVEIPKTLDMLPYLKVSSTKDEPKSGTGATSMPYELISVLMHVGSALSGHYFAYIKDTSSERWLKFNDAVVTELEDVQLDEILGSSSNMADADGKNRSLDNIASSNAYMLVYREISEANLSSVPVASIPDELVKEVQDENKKFHTLKAEWEEEHKWLNLSVYYDGPATSIRVHKDSTVGKLAVKVIEAFAPALIDVTTSRIRLRTFDLLRNRCLAPLGADDTILSELPEDILRRPLKVEVRDPDGDFEDYVINGLNFDLLLLVDRNPSSEKMFLPQVSLCIKKDASVGCLRAAVAKRLKIVIERTTLVWFPGDSPIQLVDDTILLTQLQISVGGTLHVEEKDLSEPSFLMQYFERLVNMVTIKFNNPSSNHVPNEAAHSDASCGDITCYVGQYAKEHTLHGEIKHIQIDARTSLRELKARISKLIHLNINEFKMMRKAGGIELKDLNMSLVTNGIEDGHALYIEVGKPMIPGEWRFDVKLILDGESAAISLDSVVINENMSTRDVKTRLYSLFSAKKEMPPPERIRLRLGTRTSGDGSIRATDVIADDCTIRASLGKKIVDGNILVVQKITGPENFTSEHMLLRVRHWRPVEKIIEPVEEIAVMRSATFSDLKIQLAARFNASITEIGSKDKNKSVTVPRVKMSHEYVSIVKPFTYLLRDLKNLPRLKWTQQPRDENKILASPMRLHDGDLIVYKDNRQSEDIIEIADGVADASIQNIPSEPLFQIFTPSQQIEREAFQEKIKEEKEQEAIARYREIKERITREDASEIPPLPPS